MTVYPNFAEFVRAEVLPLQDEHPEWVRLDGVAGGDNRTVVGRFIHHGTTWKVHADTHFQPLLAAFASAERGADPFTEKPTKTDRCLELVPELRPEPASPKHLYIYADG